MFLSSTAQEEYWKYKLIQSDIKKHSYSDVIFKLLYIWQWSIHLLLSIIYIQGSIISLNQAKSLHQQTRQPRSLPFKFIIDHSLILIASAILCSDSLLNNLHCLRKSGSWIIFLPLSSFLWFIFTDKIKSNSFSKSINRWQTTSKADPFSFNSRSSPSKWRSNSPARWPCSSTRNPSPKK